MRNATSRKCGAQRRRCAKRQCLPFVASGPFLGIAELTNGMLLTPRADLSVPIAERRDGVPLAHGYARRIFAIGRPLASSSTNLSM
jgi:hypothetical protein